MSRKTEKALKELLMNNYGHYSRQHEKELLSAILLEREFKGDFNIQLTGKESLESLGAYDYPLASDPLRSTKNGFICLVAVMCRTAADMGADNLKSYALSDYFINRIESEFNMTNWMEILMEIVTAYQKLVRERLDKEYSKTVKDAVTFISEHLYDAVSLSDVAKHLSVSEEYLAARFKKETGETTGKYTNRIKLQEAKTLLEDGKHTVTEVSDLLAYGSVSSFSKVFSKFFGFPPGKVAKGTLQAVKDDSNIQV